MTYDEERGKDGHCPTVMIQTKDGPVMINESEYDPKAHTLVGEEKKPPAPPTMTRSEFEALSDEERAETAKAGVQIVDDPKGGKKQK